MQRSGWSVSVLSVLCDWWLTGGPGSLCRAVACGRKAGDLCHAVTCECSRLWVDWVSQSPSLHFSLNLSFMKLSFAIMLAWCCHTALMVNFFLLRILCMSVLQPKAKVSEHLQFVLPYRTKLWFCCCCCLVLFLIIVNGLLSLCYHTWLTHG